MSNLYRGNRKAHQSSGSPSHATQGGRFRAGQFPGAGTYNGEPSGTGFFWNVAAQQWLAQSPAGMAPGLDPRGPNCAANACMASDPMALGQCGPCCLIKIVGFKSEAAVASGDSVTICQSPAWDFLPFLITVPSSIAEFFELSDIEIANSNAIDGDPILAQSMSEVATYHMLSIGCSTGAREVCVTATNVDPALDAHTFYLTMFGYTLES